VISSKKYLFVIAVVAVVMRLLYIFSIQPGNAPDEHAHMAFIKSIANNKIMSFKEGLKTINYPYATLNPLGYIPASIALKACFLKQGIDSGRATEFSFQECIYSRIGLLVWTVFYIGILTILVRDISPYGQAITLTLCLFIPQIIFVQSYCNLDSLGLFGTVYVIFATLKNIRSGLLISSAVLSCSKLNSYCAYTFSAIFILSDKKTPFIARIKSIALILIGGILGLSWMIYSWWINTKEYHSFLGMSAWNNVLNYTPGGVRIFSKDFISASINSSFGMFGWMDIVLNDNIYSIWIISILIPSLAILFIDSIRRNLISIALLFGVVASAILHMLASYTSVYNPQGRYLLPGLILLFMFPIEKKSVFYKIPLKITALYIMAVITFVVYSNVVALNLISTLRDNPAEKFFYKKYPGDKTPQSAFNFISKKPSSPISPNYSIKQTFISQRQFLNEIAINFGTYRGRKNGIITIEIKDDAENTIFQKNIEINKLYDCRYHHLDLDPPIATSVGKKYNIKISSREIDPTRQIAVFFLPLEEIKKDNPLIPNKGNETEDKILIENCYINMNASTFMLDYKLY
jgi:hypothetical protein